ncbi:hypothetical protein U1Q18_018493 [Sarracenia purpurea var. burkii]
MEGYYRPGVGRWLSPVDGGGQRVRRRLVARRRRKCRWTTIRVQWCVVVVEGAPVILGHERTPLVRLLPEEIVASLTKNFNKNNE